MIVAWTMLLSWPVVAMTMFRAISTPAALCATIIGGYLLLPEQVRYKVPGLPSFGKETITVLVALLACLLIRPPQGAPKGFVPRSMLGFGLLALFAVGTVATVLTNSDTLFANGRVFPAIPPSDSLVLLLDLFVFLIPFFLGRKFLATSAAQLRGLKVMVGFALLYSLMALFEIRMSPQLNNWIYGFFPHSFEQHVRGGGYRPLVFLNHGLWLAIFLATATLAAIGLTKVVPKEEKAVFLLSALWLYGTLFLTKSLGAFLITTLLAAMWFFLPMRLLRMGLIGLICVVLTYPVLRTIDIVPVDQFVNMASKVSTDRAGSLNFRIRVEEGLLEHARERYALGWGEFGRNLAVDVEGIRTVVPDGYWVISIGSGGYVRYFSEFGLLCLGALTLLFRRKEIDTVSLTVLILLTANLIDLLPNGTLTMVTWLWAGALLGRTEINSALQPVTEKEELQEQRKPRYARHDPASAAPYRRNFSDGPHKP